MECQILFSDKNISKCCLMKFLPSMLNVNPNPAEPGYVLSLQTVLIQISWILKKPTDLDLHCLPLSM